MIFKSIDPSDVAIRKFRVYKSWGVDNSTISQYGITVQDGIKDNTPFSIGDFQNSDGTYKKLIWKSINHLYYKSGSIHIDNPAYNYVNSSTLKYVSRSIEDGIRVINIPSLIYGDQIKPNSVLIESNSLKIVDDGNYNLYISGTFPRNIVGNVFYDTGHIIITSQSYTSSLDYFDLSFKSTIEIKELEVVCTVLESEFNYTNNPTAASGSSGYYISEIASSSIKPFITTIGLYDDDGELLMIGKLSKPFKRNYDLDTTFVLKIDI